MFTYLKHFPENTFALPPTFRKVVRGLNASHWLAKKVIEMKDRRWRLREGQESEYGRMSLDEVEKIKHCNAAFWECYINRRPPDDILNKKRKQYERKTEHNKTSRAAKKPKTDGQADGMEGPVSNEVLTPTPVVTGPVSHQASSSCLDPTTLEGAAVLDSVVGAALQSVEAPPTTDAGEDVVFML